MKCTQRFVVDNRSNMESSNEMSKGRILMERVLESVGSGLVSNVNCPKEIELTAMNPVLAY